MDQRNLRRARTGTHARPRHKAGGPLAEVGRLPTDSLSP